MPSGHDHPNHSTKVHVTSPPCGERGRSRLATDMDLVRFKSLRRRKNKGGD
jgi:hypothetical protein